MQTIEVIASRPEGITISSKQITTMPGGFGDPLKALDALPGVVLATPANSQEQEGTEVTVIFSDNKRL